MREELENLVTKKKNVFLIMSFPINPNLTEHLIYHRGYTGRQYQDLHTGVDL